MRRQLSEEPLNLEADPADLDAEAPSIDRFYVRCNFPVPRIDAGSWRLELGAGFDRSRSWSLDALRALPSVERTVLLECAGNGRTLMSPVPAGTPWGVGAVGIARFSGVRLSDVLANASLGESARTLVFTGADAGTVKPDGTIPYQFDLPIAEVALADPILASTMNGEPLPPEHGYPLRLVVPGHYGMRSVKWLTRIDAVEDSRPDLHFPRKYRYRGQEGVPDETPVDRMRVRALLTHPARGETLEAGPVRLRGLAWSGSAPIDAVEIGVDGTWHAADVVEPLADEVGVRWELGWTATGGDHEISVRATDATGATQPDAPIWNEGGYGNNVVERVRFRVGQPRG
ncbi:MAG: sulfite oxidase [Chloroflexi bacterium]|nr:sulfite oxidase [Chloroflexota bacterium]